MVRRVVGLGRADGAWRNGEPHYVRHQKQSTAFTRATPGVPVAPSEDPQVDGEPRV